MPPAPDTPPLDGTAWVLAALPGAELAPGAPATLRFEDGRAAGSDGCNRYTVGYTAQGDAIAFPGSAATTRMACPPDVTRQSDAFLAALAGARRYRVEGGRLQLLSADGSLRAALAPQPQTLAGTSWSATAIHNGKGAVASLVAGSAVTLTFGADGQASGSAGCNRYMARYQAEGSSLRFQPAAATRRMCPGEALMEQERAFLKALESVATARIEGQRLELRTAGGSLAATLQREGGS
jgi:heat shock protein HslJ